MLYEKDKIYYQTIEQAKKLIGEENIVSIIDNLIKLNEYFIDNGKEDKVCDIDEEYHNFLLKNKKSIRYDLILHAPYKIHEMGKDNKLKTTVKSFDNMYEALKYRRDIIKNKI